MNNWIIGFLAVVLVALSTEGRSVREQKPIVKNEDFDKNIPDKETVLNATDFENAKKLPSEKMSTQTRRTTGMENPNMFEGDIANKGLNSSTIARFMGLIDSNNTALRNAIRSTNQRWPGAIIPYTISTQYSTQARSVIADAIAQFTNKTCIRIIPRTNQNDYVHIVPEDGCFSNVGRIGGRQILSLGSGCVRRGIVMHEFMHAVGFFHEQSRPDRDNFVEVLLQNIETGFASQFAKLPTTRVDYLGQPYDYSSIMHYESRSFSKNGMDTIRPVAAARARGVRLVGTATNEFSAIDVRELNIIAQCPNRGG